jgi:DHA1 family bicyclomycin/chloramphenicol resistance-like MFS transporter
VRPRAHRASSAPSRIGLIVLLGGLTALGPLSIDMYLPAFPTLGRAFASHASEVQLTLTAVMVGLAAGQAFAGPLSDALGRRRPLIAGLAAYVAASILCAVTPSMYVLIGARFLQGLAGAVGLVIARAVVRDVFDGSEVARFFSWLMLVMGAAPILAPTIGSAILRLASWRTVFVALAAYGALVLIVTAVSLPETLTVDRRRSGGIREVLQTFSRLLGNPQFVGYTLAAAFAGGSMFAYIAGSPFVLQDMYGVSPQVYGLIFGANAAGIIAMSQLNHWLLGRFDVRSLLVLGLVVSAAGGVALLVVIAIGGIGLVGLLPCFFVVVSMVGIVNPNATALALADHPDIAGSASGVLGVIQFVLGAAIAPLVGIAGTTTAFPLGIAIAACGAAGLASLAVSGRPQAVRAA